MTAHPEYELQTLVTKWVRQHVVQPHFFFSIDRSKATSRLTHVREKNRGLRAGTPDTILMVHSHHQVIAAELKAPGGKLTPAQLAVGDAIRAAGHTWFWCSGVVEYANTLYAIGVPLIGNWQIAAENSDATLLGAAIKRDEAGGVVSKKRFKRPEDKPTAARLRKVERIRAAGVRI